VIKIKITNKQIKRILRLTASLDPDGSIRGYDYGQVYFHTECYTSFEIYAQEVRNILECVDYEEVTGEG